MSAEPRIRNKISKHVAAKWGTRRYTLNHINGMEMFEVNWGKFPPTRLQRHEAEALYLGLREALSIEDSTP